MIFNTLFLVAALATQAIALPTAPAEPARDMNAEDWSMLHFRRACAEDQSSCDYSFSITEFASKEPKYCQFRIKADGRPAYQTGFSLIKCPEVAEYSINGGWNDLGFFTLSVINVEKSLISWFSYKDDILMNGVEAGPQHSKVYFHPIAVPAEVEVAKRDSHNLAAASEWQLINVVRYLVKSGTPQETVVLSFSIEGGDEPSQYCLLQIPVVQQDGTSTKSFYNRACLEGAKGWTVSWGQDETTDEAVMTLVNQDQHKHAFFGFNNVSKGVLLGNNGPSPTKDLPKFI
ncbi:hypothetical protein COL26b_000191 [Colletotrichum chrysophilum]|uniref:uncharacterized protein n=1 Tax=Colletotrichum chrysophilum TaxID=1836956 RepID=UPI002301D04C|nr:uncharacterized protein COL26b_000191 [Colletotrichum chrysophilum]KAJ0381513.1 hypothetical protein COL26b_000191 [Colletotrichum chrysophilum]